MQNAELLMESSKRIVEPTTTPAGIKTVLFHVHDDDAQSKNLLAALSVARAFRAHIHLLHVTPIDAYTVTDPYGTFVSTEIVRVLEDEASKLRAVLEKRLADEDVSWTYEEVTSGVLPHVIQRATLADVLVTSRSGGDGGFGRRAIAVLGDLIHRIRTPLLIAGDGPNEFDPFGTAMIAWNASYEAANTLRCAVPLLKLASEVRLVTVTERDDRRFPPTAALEYLSRHDIHAELVERESKLETVDEQILDQAAIDGASYIVMGGYSHSRAGEFLFGGVTRSLLESCPVSLFVSH